MKYKIKPEKITKPIQLLASSIVGLISIDWLFLHYAINFNLNGFLKSALVIASICNVPIFILSIFYLQTKFRAELQDDEYYSKYLENKTGNTKGVLNLSKENSLEDTLTYIEEIKEFLTDNKNDELYQELIENKAKISIIEQRLIMGNSSVQLNPNLLNAKIIENELINSNISIESYFGVGAKHAPTEFALAFGKGFTNEMLDRILKAIIKVSDGYIMYSKGDEYTGEYDNVMLVGAYGVNSINCKTKISDVISMLENGYSNTYIYNELEEKKDKLTHV